MQFNLIVTGLDSVEARRWINATLVNMVDEENQDSLKPMIDGGTEGEMPTVLLLEATVAETFMSRRAGFKGQARVILPTITSCFECSVSLAAGADHTCNFLTCLAG